VVRRRREADGEAVLRSREASDIVGLELGHEAPAAAKRRGARELGADLGFEPLKPQVVQRQRRFAARLAEAVEPVVCIARAARGVSVSPLPTARFTPASAAAV
jgi:hypothetical protein